MNHSYNQPATTKQQGFTLIELMITVAIVAILASIAIPSYRQYTIKSNRSAAQSFILNLANKEVQYMLDARSYTSNQALLATTPANVSNNYTILITLVAGPPQGFTIKATPIGGQLTGDTRCGFVTIDQAGTKDFDTSLPGSVKECW